MLPVKLQRSQKPVKARCYVSLPLITKERFL